MLFPLRAAFRAGDVWLARSRRYGDIRKALLSAPAVADADRSLPAPASPHDWLAERRFAEGPAPAGRRGAGRCGRWRKHRRQRAPRREDGNRRAGREPLTWSPTSSGGCPRRGRANSWRRPVGHRETLRRLAKITWRLLEIGAILESSTGEVGRW